MIGVKDIIAQSFSLVKRDIKIWLSFIVCEVGVSLLILAVRMGSTIISFFVDKGISLFVVGTILLFLFVGLFLLGLWINIALIRVIGKRLRGESNLPLLSELHECRHIVARTLGTITLFNIFVFLPIAVCLIGFSTFFVSALFFGKDLGSVSTTIFAVIGLYGIFHAFFFSIEYGFANMAVILDGQHIRQAFHGSKVLISGRFVSVLWRFIAPLAVYVFIFFILGVILTDIGKLSPNVVLFWTLWILGLFLGAFFPLLFTSSLVTLYMDLKKTLVPPSVSAAAPIKN